MKTDPNPRNEPLPVSDWLSIEQAPRDGTWVEGRWDTVDGRRQEEFDEKIRFDSELGRWTTPRTSLEALRHPTHFRPLHPTPEAGATRETPETDAFKFALWAMLDKLTAPITDEIWKVNIKRIFDHSEHLERERDEAQSDVRQDYEALQQVNNELVAHCEDIQRALTASRAEAEGLRGELEALKQTIGT